VISLAVWQMKKYNHPMVWGSLILSVCIILCIPGVGAHSNNLHVALFIPITEVVNGIRSLSVFSQVEDVAHLALALAAGDLINTRSPLLPGLANSSCDVNLEFSIHDSLRDYRHTLKQYFYLKDTNGIPDLIIGPQRSASTIPLSFVTTTDNVPLIGYAATGHALDGKLQHPYYFRTIPSDASVSERLAKLFLRFGWTRVAMIYVEDEYGRNYKDGLFQHCENLGIDLSIFPFSHGDSVSIIDALSRVKESKLNVIMAVVFESDAKLFVTEAARLGLAGRNKAWVLSDAFGGVHTLDALVSADRTLAEALNGTLQIRAIPGEGDPSILEYAKKFFENSSLHERVARSLPGGVNSTDYLLANGTASFVPITVNSSFFEGYQLDYFGSFVFDAVLAAAYALEASCAEFLQRGRIALINELETKTFGFEGISGTVAFDEETGSRDSDTVRIVALNHVFVDDGAGQLKTVQWVGAEYSSAEGAWKLNDGLVFPPGDAVQIPLYTDKPEIEEISPSKEAQLAMFVLTTLNIVFILLLICWTLWNRNVPVVKASQPLYLVCVSTGLILSCSSMYFLGWDGLSFSLEKLSSFCNAFAWFLSLGLTLSTMGFISKLWKIIYVFGHAERMDGPRKSYWFIPLVVLGALFFNILILSLWLVYNPLVFVRREIEFDSFGQVTVIDSRCRQIDTSAFLIILILFHVSQYLAGMILTYKARQIPDDFQENKWVTIAFVIQLQLVILATPVLLAVQFQAPTTSYAVLGILIFLVNASIASLLFGPKIHRVLYGETEVSLRVDKSKYRIERTHSGLGTRSFENHKAHSVYSSNQCFENKTNSVDESANEDIKIKETHLTYA